VFTSGQIDDLMAKVHGDRILKRHRTGVTWGLAFEQLNLVSKGIRLPRGATATSAPSGPSPATNSRAGRVGGCRRTRPRPGPALGESGTLISAPYLRFHADASDPADRLLPFPALSSPQPIAKGTWSPWPIRSRSLRMTS
jgi:hypothetical protein